MVYLTAIQQTGCIINVSSLMAIKAGLGVTAYAASKAGVVGTSCIFFSMVLTCHFPNIHVEEEQVSKRNSPPPKGRDMSPSIHTQQEADRFKAETQSQKLF